MQFLTTRNCRRRKIQTLGVIVLITIIYFLLQFFSLSRLGGANKSEKTSNFQGANMGRDEMINDDETKDEKDGKHQNSNSAVGRHEQQDIPRGVHLSQAAQYAKVGLFKCLKSELHIPVEQVNDDFCDCPDSSDEPGTSACPRGRFYCTVQLPHEDAQSIDSSKVNDGICDCCDGSDEWKGRQVPAVMRLHGKRGAVFHTPCVDRCGDILQLMEHEERIRRQGVLLQKRYLDAARGLSPRHLLKFGPLGIFFLLSKECYQHAAHEYLYTVCPFESVQQSRGSALKTVLGRQGQWSQQKPGDYILDMVAGDAALCPEGQSRETRIRFLCGLEDRVISVSEDQKCRYIIRFSTPAAC
ncbi:uncharacterized protein LOC143291067 [Babylonia areolata]|uniref:uncharacterized protein LOC143291067 n=1 Tax=Babylonia areolata TaxID=304850 RepID=UPI003FD09182